MTAPSPRWFPLLPALLAWPLLTGADQHAPGEVIQDTLKDGSPGPELVVIPAGEFTMGSPEDEIDRGADEAGHPVTIPKPFAMGRHEVTIGQFRRFVDATGHVTEGERGGGCGFWDGDRWGMTRDKHWQQPGFPVDDEHPAVCVSWNDALVYARWLSEQTGETYRLPTEAEWEYAARAGSTTPFHFGATLDTDQANYYGEEAYGEGQPGEYRSATVAVGQFPANAWGLHDMHGNVWEWTCSGYNPEYQEWESECIDPRFSGIHRVIRGGSWDYPPRHLRAATRQKLRAEARNYSIGLRLVREL